MPYVQRLTKKQDVGVWEVCVLLLLKPKRDDIILFLRMCFCWIYKESTWITAKKNMQGKDMHNN